MVLFSYLFLWQCSSQSSFSFTASVNIFSRASEEVLWDSCLQSHWPVFKDGPFCPLLCFTECLPSSFFVLGAYQRERGGGASMSDSIEGKNPVDCMWRRDTESRWRGQPRKTRRKQLLSTFYSWIFSTFYFSLLGTLGVKLVLDISQKDAAWDGGLDITMWGRGESSLFHWGIHVILYQQLLVILLPPLSTPSFSLNPTQGEFTEVGTQRGELTDKWCILEHRSKTEGQLSQLGETLGGARVGAFQRSKLTTEVL